MLHIADITQQPADFPAAAELAQTYSYPLDTFQKHAIAAIHKDANVLVTAKTGSGKTLVGEYAIAYQLQRGRRIFYTTPIKSLSNQKFHDLDQLFPGQVGIMTGDIKFKPDAQVIVMTTEILRNLLYKQGTATASLGLAASLTLDGLGAVIFDEVHYINDRSRGKVWEETMILLPAHVQLILLSATIDKPELFAAWLGELKQVPIWLIPTSHRVVPLTHYVFSKGELLTIMDAKEEFHADTYRNWLKGLDADEKAHDKFKSQVKAKNVAGDKGGLKNKVGKQHSFQHRLNELTTFLYDKSLLPALFFVFSRKDCEKFAKQITGSLIDPSDAAQVKHLIHYHFRDKREQIEKLPSFWQLYDLMMRGIAFHHSGMLPALKEVVELVFGKGLIRALFATETFAVGINMPTKTVVFTSYEKYSDECDGHRVLNTDEYIQMAGRAGRRGKDALGYVIYLPYRDPASLDEVKGMMKGRRAQVESRMDFHYDFILKTILQDNLSWAKLMKDSYWWKQIERAREQMQRELEEMRARGIPQAGEVDFEERWKLEEAVKGLVNAKKKAAQRQLTAWLDEHDGVRWEIGWKNFLALKELRRKIALLEEDIAHTDSIMADTVEPAFRFLEATGFLEETRTLTKKGILATEINEGHNILFATIFEQGLCSELSQAEQVGFFAAFLEDESDPPETTEIDAFLKKVGGLAASLAAKEKVPSPAGFWKISKSWVGPLMSWVRGGTLEEVCAEHGCYEGNLIRSILKVGNMLEEWRGLATFTGAIDELKRLEGLVVVRDIAVPDSLYLHL